MIECRKNHLPIAFDTGFDRCPLCKAITNLERLENDFMFYTERYEELEKYYSEYIKEIKNERNV